MGIAAVSIRGHPPAPSVPNTASGGTLDTVECLRRHAGHCKEKIECLQRHSGHCKVPPEALWAPNSASGGTLDTVECLWRHSGHYKVPLEALWAPNSGGTILRQKALLETLFGAKKRLRRHLTVPRVPPEALYSVQSAVYIRIHHTYACVYIIPGMIHTRTYA